MELLRAFYVEHMVDHGSVLSWLAAQVGPANIAQLYFVLRLVEEYLDDLAEHRSFVQPVIEGLLAKLAEVRPLLSYMRKQRNQIGESFRLKQVRCLKSSHRPPTQ